MKHVGFKSTGWKYLASISVLCGYFIKWFHQTPKLNLLHTSLSLNFYNWIPELSSRKCVFLLERLFSWSLVLVGDFNLPDVCWRLNAVVGKRSGRFLECLGDGFLIQLVGWLAKVTPIYKKGSGKDLGNCRPVGLTSVPGKLTERIALGVTMRCVQGERVMSPSPHGFVGGGSCLTGLVSFYDKMTRRVDGGSDILLHVADPHLPVIQFCLGGFYQTRSFQRRLAQPILSNWDSRHAVMERVQVPCSVTLGRS